MADREIKINHSMKSSAISRSWSHRHTSAQPKLANKIYPIQILCLTYLNLLIGLSLLQPISSRSSESLFWLIFLFQPFSNIQMPLQSFHNL